MGLCNQGLKYRLDPHKPVPTGNIENHEFHKYYGSNLNFKFLKEKIEIRSKSSINRSKSRFTVPKLIEITPHSRIAFWSSRMRTPSISSVPCHAKLQLPNGIEQVLPERVPVAPLLRFVPARRLRRLRPHGRRRAAAARPHAAARVSAVTRQPRSLLPAGPQRVGKSCSFFVLTTCCFLQTFFQELKPLLMCSGCSFLVVHAVSSSFQELKRLLKVS
jgi:hypothetical protein